MIYVDTSVALAHLLAEERKPPATIWEQPLVSSRLLEYEIWNRLYARKGAAAYRHDARGLIGRVYLLGLAPAVLARALEPFPTAVRTLDGLHLASMEFLRTQGQSVELASYDKRLIAAAQALGIPLVAL